MRPLLFLLLLVSCAGSRPTICTSRCGLRVLAAPTDWCSHLQRAEDATLRAFAKVRTDARFAKSCTAFAGWEIVVKPAESWTTGAGAKVAGMTYCDLAFTEVNGVFPDAAGSSLGHEMAHVVQGCTPLPPYAGLPYTQAYYHSNWGAIYSALESEELGP